MFLRLEAGPSAGSIPGLATGLKQGGKLRDRPSSALFNGNFPRRQVPPPRQHTEAVRERCIATARNEFPQELRGRGFIRGSLKKA